MSCCEEVNGNDRVPGTGCCGTSCAGQSSGCPSFTPRIVSCHCQSNVGCLDHNDCGGFRPSGSAATGACPGPCQCVEEEIWNSNVPPKPNCEWLSNFSELRRQWSDHARQQNCKCCNCRPCRTAAPCQPCLPTTLRTCGFVGASSDCQDRREQQRLAGGASDKRELSPAESTESPRDSHKARRESGGGSPSLGCGRSHQTTRCRSPSTDRSSSSSWNPSSSFRPSASYRGATGCQVCASSPKSILKKRDCCMCKSGCCMCQPMPRNCNCPPPVQIDARADHECTCDCPSSPECACPPSERRFTNSLVKCPNARLCCPVPRLPPGPKCRCLQCQPCLPPPCDPCTSTICRPSLPPKTPPCRSISPSCSPCSRSRSPDCNPPSTYRSGRSSSPYGRTTKRCCNERASRFDDNNTYKHPSNVRPSSAMSCERRKGQFPWIRRRRAGGDPYDAGEAERNYEPTSANDRERPPSQNPPYDITNSIDDDLSSPRYYEAERKSGGCSYKIDTSTDPRRNESERCDIIIPDDHANDLGSDIIDDRTRDSSRYSSCVQDRSQCRCGWNEIGCDSSCDYCCSLGKTDYKETPPPPSRCRCAPDGNGCDQTCGYCCALTNSNGILAEGEEQLGTSNVISSDANRRSRDSKEANVTRGVVGPVGGDGTATVAWTTCTQTYRCDRNKRNNLFSYMGAIGHSTLSPGPLTLLSFVLLIFIAITCSSGLTIYHRYFFPKNLCLRYYGRC